MSSAPVVNERITFRTRYLDDHVLIVEKPPRLVTMPGKGHENDTLLNGLMAFHGPRLRKLGSDRGFGLLHRLDKGTSGLLAVALSIEAYDGLRAQFENRSIEKYYWAVCHKAPAAPKGVVKKPIGERTIRQDKYSTRKEARLAADGAPALTAYRVLQDSGLAALIEARPVTGRMHQVRLHLDFIGSAILGDDLYGPRSIRLASPRLALHAHRLVFQHPVLGKKVDVDSPWPRDLRALLRRMRLDAPGEAPETAEQSETDLDLPQGVGVESNDSDGSFEDGDHEIRGDAVGDEQS